MNWKLMVVLILFVSGLISSCTEASNAEKKSSLEAMVDQFAPLECRAIRLREHRFALANEIRFTQDTLSKVTTKSETDRLDAKLKKLSEARETTTQQSLVLADSIKRTLDSILSNHLTKKEDRDQFNKLLHTKLEQMHCGEQL